jgi:hypothetical protein
MTFPFPFAAAAAASRTEEEEEGSQQVRRVPEEGGTPRVCVPVQWHCAAHRHAESHSCGFDHRGVALKRIASEKPTVIVAAKVTETLTLVTGQ